MHKSLWELWNESDTDVGRLLQLLDVTYSWFLIEQFNVPRALQDFHSSHGMVSIQFMEYILQSLAARTPARAWLGMPISSKLILLIFHSLSLTCMILITKQKPRVCENVSILLKDLYLLGSSRFGYLHKYTYKCANCYSSA